jgi:L-asparaginase
MPKIALIQTGGTMDSIGADRLDLAWYIEAGQRLAEGELVARVPELSSPADVEEIPFRRLVSHALSQADWLELASLVSALLQRDFDGVVVTHGTNTLEETAYFLSLVVRSDKPVVIVGSMRPASGLSADGYLNLVNAVRVAADKDARGHGVLVVLNDTIHSARDVTKTATFRVDAFRGRDLGPLGYADADGRVLFWHRTLKRHTAASEFAVEGPSELPRVDIVVSYVGADGTAIDALVAAGTRGIVSAGTGAGRPTPLEDAALDRAVAAGVSVVQSSRVGSGRVVRSPGLRKRHIVAADNLLPWKARILLSLALTRTSDIEEIQRMFDTY